MSECGICGAPKTTSIGIDNKQVDVCLYCEKMVLGYMRMLARTARRKPGSLPLILAFPSPLESPYPSTPEPPPSHGGQGVPASRASARSLQPFLLKTEQTSSPDIEEVVKAWNGYFSLPRIEVMGKRAKRVRAALDNEYWREHWKEALKKLVVTPFCMGKGKPRNGLKPWRADFDWFLDPESIEKLLNGKYDGDNPEAPKIRDYTREEI